MQGVTIFNNYNNSLKPRATPDISSCIIIKCVSPVDVGGQVGFLAPWLVVDVVRLVVVVAGAQTGALVEEPRVEGGVPGSPALSGLGRKTQGDLLADVPLTVPIQLGPPVRRSSVQVPLPRALLVALVSQVLPLCPFTVVFASLGGPVTQRRASLLRPKCLNSLSRHHLRID